MRKCRRYTSGARVLSSARRTQQAKPRGAAVPDDDTGLAELAGWLEETKCSHGFVEGFNNKIRVIRPIILLSCIRHDWSPGRRSI